MRRGIISLCVIVHACLGIPTLPKNQPLPKADPKDFAVEVINPNTDHPAFNPTTTTKLEAQFPPVANPVSDAYPLLPPSNYYIKPDEYEVAPPLSADPTKKDFHGVEQPIKSFGQPAPERNPMEYKTPLEDPRPCYEDRALIVDVVPAVRERGRQYATLPPKYGCSSAGDNSREKASPAIRVTNFTAAEVKEFSIHMISMGEGKTCGGPGTPNFNAIHWHVVGIKPTFAHPLTDHELVIAEGASKDRRLLYGGTEQANQWLEDYYGGPCPAPDTTECLRVKVLAHLHDGANCICGFQDVLFYRPAPAERTQTWSYTPGVVAKVAKAAAATAAAN